MILDITILLFTLVTLVLLTGNNIGALKGPYRSLSQLRYASSILILLGVLLGAIIEGGKLSRFYAAYQLDANEIIILLFSVVLIVIIGSHYKTPVSLNMTIVSGVWGINILASPNFDIEYTLYLLAAWILLPLFSIILSLAISYLLTRVNIVKGWGGYSIEKFVSLISSLFLSYVFGANTLGLIYSIVAPTIIVPYETIILLLITILSYLIGLKYFSRGVETELGYNIYNIGLISLISSQLSTFISLEIATQLGVPVSLTQILTISLLGASLSRKLKLINMKYIGRMSKIWIGSLILGFLVSLSLNILVYLAIGKH